ncbi:hypothetical protein ACIA8C_23835 [Nocardia sp. NPDC051321]|uniref:hypothetical protein n=1 Tax=Nocardia sp. NPDC051321 TaxID=3364323 RepID=UPI0037B51812
MMRSTVSLDHDVAQLIEKAVCKQGRSKTRIVNDALRRALSNSAAVPNRADSPDVAPESAPQTSFRPVGQSEHAAITTASARYFGLPEPPPLLRVMKASID